MKVIVVHLLLQVLAATAERKPPAGTDEVKTRTTMPTQETAVRRRLRVFEVTAVRELLVGIDAVEATIPQATVALPRLQVHGATVEQKVGGAVRLMMTVRGPPEAGCL